MATLAVVGLVTAALFSQVTLVLSCRPCLDCCIEASRPFHAYFSPSLPHESSIQDGNFPRQTEPQISKLPCSMKLGLNIIVYMQGVYAPSEIDGRMVVTYEDRIANLTQTLYRDMNTTLYNYRAPANESLITRLSPSDWSALNRYSLRRLHTLKCFYKYGKAEGNPCLLSTVKACN